MANKKSKGRDQRHKVAFLGALPVQEVLAKGHLFLTQEKYQDAILCFKQLLKQQESPEILQALEQAYLGRIRSLAAKSMTKEAMVLLETVVGRWPNADVGHLKLSLLLQAGRFVEAVEVYKQCVGQLTRDRQQRVEALFGALLLFGTGGLTPQNFPEDSPIFCHYPAARLAMHAIFAEHEERALAALKELSFRSPYRDLRTLLSGFLQFAKDKEKGCQFLHKIEKDSPYFPIAGRYLAAADTPRVFLQKLAATPKNERPRLRAAYNLHLDQFQALEALSVSDGEPLGLYHIIRRHENCFDKKRRIQLLKNILPFCHGQAFSLLARNFDFDLSEKTRICALAAEKDGATGFAVEFWEDFLGKPSKWEPARHKEIAMVMRRQAKLKTKDDYEYSPTDVLGTWLKSLEYDSGHAATWLDAAEYAKGHVSLARASVIISDAVAKLPKNVPILVAAMQASGERSAHKKAAGLAKRVLEIDPINTSALDFLVESRLEHGRKLALQKKWLLAEKELQSADTRVKAVRYRGRNRICLGMLLLLQNKEEGLLHIAAGKEENSSLFLSHVLTSLEARLYKLPKPRQMEFDRQLQQLEESGTAIGRDEFLRLVNWLMSFAGEQRSLLQEVCRCLTKSFAEAVGLSWSRDEGLLICKTLERADQIAALGKFSAVLQKKYPDDLEFRVWSLVAGTRKGKKRVPMRVADEIDDLLDRLEDKGHIAFVDYIEDLMNKGRRPAFPSFFEEEELEDIFDFGPFKIPKSSRSGEKSQPKPKAGPTGGKQLNLFDEEQ